MKARAVRAVGALLLGLSWACNIGAPLIDTQLLPDGGPIELKCNPPPLCVPLTVSELALGSATPIAHSACADCDTHACDLDTDAGAVDSDLASPAADGCKAPALPPSAAGADLWISGPAAEGQSTLDSPEWSQSNLTLIARVPWRISLRAPALSGVYLRLQGPVQLHIDHAAQIDDVRITGVSTPAGAPSVELVQSSAHALIVGDSEHQFAGPARLQDVVVSDTLMTGTTVELDSAVLMKVRIATHAVTGTDVSLTDAMIEADSVLLSALTASGSTIHSCTGATYVASTIQRSTLSGCGASVVIHLYSDKILSSAVDGSIDSDGSNWENTRLGIATTTDATFFHSTISAAIFCSAATHVALGSASEIKCSSCERQLEADDFCVVPSENQAPRIYSNYCIPLLSPVAQCEDPVPERVRPEIPP